MPSMSELVAIGFIAILGSLAAALFFMLRKGPENGSDAQRRRRMARALAVRVGLSIVLFAAVLLAYRFGLIQPTGLPAG